MIGHRIALIHQPVSCRSVLAIFIVERSTMTQRSRTGSTLLVLIGLCILWLLNLERALAEPPLAGEAIYVADSYTDQVLGFVDRDDSGMVQQDAQGEVFSFYVDAGAGPDLSIPSALILGMEGEILLLDGGTLDAVFILTDRDGDGSANGNGEWAVFYDDSSSGPNLSTPGSMALGPAGELYIADDGRGAGHILRLIDQDGDGNALGDDEWKIVYDRFAFSTAEYPLEDIEEIALLPDGRLLACDSTLMRIYWMSDVNGDGDFFDAGEVGIFYDPRGNHEASGFRGLAVDSGGVVFAVDANGLVIRLQDMDLNGNAMEAGEWNVFLDPGQPPHIEDAGGLALASDGTLVILDKKRDAVILARDLDGDHTATGIGETLSWLDDGGKLLSTPSAVVVGPAPREPDVLISGVVPPDGPITGGTVAQILGKFKDPESAVVTFDGLPAEIVIATVDSIECVTPPGARQGPVDVWASTTAGVALMPGGFTYLQNLFIRGDGTGDGQLDISDAVKILGYLFLEGSSADCEDALDVDDDGDLSITDPIYLLGFLFQGGDSPPPPFPEPGIDETPDAFTCLNET